MPQERRQRRSISRQEKVERLQIAAISVIARQGVSEASTRAIATEAGLNLATVHYAFDGKDDLLTSLLGRVLKESSDLITKVAQESKTAQEAIARMADAYWDHAVRYPDLQRVNYELGLYALTNREYGDRSKLQFSANHDHIAGLLQPLLPNWTKAQVAVLTVACVSSMEGLIIQYLVMQDRETCEKVLALNVKALQLLCANAPIEARL